MKDIDGAQRRLWEEVASGRGSASKLGPIWKRAANWLLEAPAGTPAVVVLSMAWGGLPWVRSYVRRVLFTGIPRFAFITPDLMSKCLRWQEEHPRGDRLLCVLAGNDCSSAANAGTCNRPYDTNNYAKFFMMPPSAARNHNVAARKPPGEVGHGLQE